METISTILVVQIAMDGTRIVFIYFNIPRLFHHFTVDKYISISIFPTTFMQILIMFLKQILNVLYFFSFYVQYFVISLNTILAGENLAKFFYFKI